MDELDGLVVPPRLASMLATLVGACVRDGRVRAAWLGGSLASGQADDWSDIDLHLVVADPSEFEAIGWVRALSPVVLADQIPGVAGGYLFLTPDWVHVDVIVHGAPDVELQDDLPAHVVLDRDRVLRGPSVTTAMPSAPYFPAEQVRLFLYFMGNAVTVLHRGELLALSQGTAVMRDQLLVPLMMAENGVRKRDGAKRLNRYLTTEQLESIAALPPFSLEESTLRAAQQALAADYLRRARRLAATCHASWPADLERAALELWRRELGIEV